MRPINTPASERGRGRGSARSLLTLWLQQRLFHGLPAREAPAADGRAGARPALRPARARSQPPPSAGRWGGAGGGEHWAPGHRPSALSGGFPSPPGPVLVGRGCSSCASRLLAGTVLEGRPAGRLGLRPLPRESGAGAAGQQITRGLRRRGPSEQALPRPALLPPPGPGPTRPPTPPSPTHRDLLERLGNQPGPGRLPCALFRGNSSCGARAYAEDSATGSQRASSRGGRHAFQPRSFPRPQTVAVATEGAADWRWRKAQLLPLGDARGPAGPSR